MVAEARGQGSSVMKSKPGRLAPPDQTPDSPITQSATWRAFLTRLGDDFGGMAGLVIHDFTAVRGQVLDFGDQWNPAFAEVYKLNGHRNPWLPFMWRERPGALILGSEVNAVSRSTLPAHEPFMDNFLTAMGLFRGIGAVLWDDRFPSPRWCVVTAVLRSGARGAYAPDEVAAYRALIPFMLLSVKSHPCVHEIESGRTASVDDLTYPANAAAMANPAFEGRRLLEDISFRFDGGEPRSIVDLSDQAVAALLMSISADIRASSMPDAMPALIQRLTMPATPNLAGRAAAAARPEDWPSAKAQHPRLLSYASAKAEDSKLSIIEHLRDLKQGFGIWTRQEPGLPRPVLARIDKTAYKALYNWLARIDPATGARREIPPDLFLPTKSDTAQVDATEEEIREAQRKAAQWRRQQARARG